MFHDMTASDVSFPNTHSSKDISRTTKSQNKFCLPKWEDGQVEEAEQGQVKQMVVIGEVYLKKDRAMQRWRDRILRGQRPELHLDPVS